MAANIRGIVFAGHFACGKSEAVRFAAEYLRNEGYRVQTQPYSVILKGIIKDTLGEEVTRKNLQGLGKALRTQVFDDQVLGRAMSRRVLRNGSEWALLDGPRWLGDVDGLSFKTKIVFIQADVETRLARTRARALRPGDAEKTEAEFLQEQAGELYVPHFAGRANELVLNNGTLEEFHYCLTEVLLSIMISS